MLLTFRERDDFFEAALVRVVAASDIVPIVIVAFLGRVETVWVLKRGGDAFLVVGLVYVLYKGGLGFLNDLG